MEAADASREWIVVGRGRMGAALVTGLRASGERVRALHGREATLPTPDGPATWVLAVRDAGIAQTAAALAPRLGPHDAALHLAGMLGPDALVAAGIPLAQAGSLHPLVARSSPREGAAQALHDAVFLFEGGGVAASAAAALAAALGATWVRAERVDRARYHAGAALVATGATALAQGAAAAFTASLSPAPDDREVRAMVASLLRSVADNVLADGAPKALASPLLRGDTDTVARHLAAFAAQPEARALYRAALAQVLTALDGPGDVVARARAVIAADAEAQGVGALTPARR